MRYHQHHYHYQRGISGAGVGSGSGDMNQALNSGANSSGCSVGASSLVTDANSAAAAATEGGAKAGTGTSASGGAGSGSGSGSAASHLQRSSSTSNNTTSAESFLGLPASPLSFSSANNMSASASATTSASSVIDGSSVTRVESNQKQDQTVAQQQQLLTPKIEPCQGQPLLQSPKMENVQVLVTPKLEKPVHFPPPSQTQTQSQQMQLMMRPKMEEQQQQQAVQQMIQRPETLLPAHAHLQRQDSIQRHSPQFQAYVQQHRLLQQQQQQQFLQSLPQHLQRSHIQQQQQQQQQLRHHLQQQQQQNHLQASSLTKQPSVAVEHGACVRRIMQYIYHQRHRPADNNIGFWRKFVAEFFAPNAKKRWCLSLYGHVGHHTLGVFPQAAMEAWQCDICGIKPGRGFEATVEVLPRLYNIKFDKAVTDELLFVDMPKEYRLNSGLILLEYGKAIEETVYDQLRVVRTGILRVIFTSELKILSWEFCARTHDELLPRRLVASQVSHLVMLSQKYQSSVAQSGTSGLSSQDLQANCHMFTTTGRQLSKNIELQSVNDLGFSKRYVRCLQIAEVVNLMKDLIDFSRESSMGPLDSLKNFPRHFNFGSLQNQSTREPSTNIQGAASDPNMKMNSGNENLNTHISSHGRVINNGSQNPTGVNSYQNLMHQNSMNSVSQNGLAQDVSSYATLTPSLANNSLQNPSHSIPYQTALSSMSGSLQNNSLVGLTSSIQQNTVCGNMLPQNQQQMLQLLQEMISSGGSPQQSLVGQGSGGSIIGGTLNGLTVSSGLPAPSGTLRGGNSVIGNSLGYRNNNIPSMSGSEGTAFSRSNSFRNMTNTPLTVGTIGSGARLNLNGIGRSQNLHVQDVMQDLPNDFPDNGIFNSLGAHGDSGDSPFAWKSS